MRALLLGAALLAAAGCAELQRPALPEPPIDLSGRLTAAPVPAVLDAAVADFAGAGQGLEGRPAATALAVARVEWLSGEFRPGRRLARLPASFMFGMQRAVAEGRNALSIAQDATPEQAVAALVAASRALTLGNQPAIDAALAAPAFARTDRPVLDRLREPGAFPDSILAVTALRDEVARLMTDRQASGGIVFDNPENGLMTYGFGGNTDR